MIFMQHTTPGTPLPFILCENFRDLGGYRGWGGKSVRYGVFYRAPALANLTLPEDRARFESLGIRTVFDFRSAKEREVAPDPVFAGVKNICISAMFEPDGTEMSFDLEKIIHSDDGIRMLTQGVHESYVRMPFDNPAYRALFAAICADETPILFHCTAGKDRTGVAAALILTMLGVSREDVIRDYLLTNDCRLTGRGEFYAYLEQAGLSPEKARQVAQVATGVRRESIENALDAIAARYPTFEAYLQAEFGIDAQTLMLIRTRYLI